jgi:hypothetical protein
MLSSIEKFAEVQKATHSFIEVLKRIACNLPGNGAQIEADLSRFSANLWKKLEAEILNQFKDEASHIEKGDPSRLVLFGPQGCPSDCTIEHPLAVFARQYKIPRSTLYRWIDKGLPVIRRRFGPRINCQQARQFLSSKPQV